MMSDSTPETDGTRVLSKDLYEWPFHNDVAECVECGESIDVDPESDAMEAPHWRKETHLPPCDDVFEALCDSCYAKEVSAILEGETA